jgi:hypothetical protein
MADFLTDYVTFNTMPMVTVASNVRVTQNLDPAGFEFLDLDVV